MNLQHEFTVSIQFRQVTTIIPQRYQYLHFQENYNLAI